MVLLSSILNLSESCSKTLSSSSESFCLATAFDASVTNATYSYSGPDKFKNVTNGITFRRWLLQCNPQLAELITENLGDDKWLTNAVLLKRLENKVEDAAFVQRYYEIKMSNKVRLAEYIETTLGIPINPNSLFSIQVKRIHEYKRQFMNALGCIHRYMTLKKMSPEERKKVVPVCADFSTCLTYLPAADASLACSACRDFRW